MERMVDSVGRVACSCVSPRASLDQDEESRPSSSDLGKEGAAAVLAPAYSGDLGSHDGDAHSDGGSGGYRFTTAQDREDIAAQRAAIWDLLKSLGSHLLREGVNLTKVSFPVRMFEPRSFLQRITDSWAYLDLLTAAAAAADPADRMKYLVAFVVGGLRRQTSTKKPFNPILGETYQGAYAAGVRVACEQISHHPPISSWQMEDAQRTFHFFGNGNWTAAARGNSIRGQQSGRNAVHFASDGATVTWNLPPLHLKGILWGERVLKYSGDITFRDERNQLECVLHIDQHAAGSFLTSLWRSKKTAQKPDQLHGVLRRAGAQVDVCHGSWLSHLEWERGAPGGKARRLWDVAASKVHAPEAVEKPLASDSRFRQDLAFLAEGDQPASQEWKSRLEELQRADRRARREGRREAGLPLAHI